MGDASIVLLFLFLPIISPEFRIGFSSGICCLYQCPSEVFSAASLWYVTFGFFLARVMKRWDNASVPAEFPIGGESANRKDMSDNITGKNWSETGDALNQHIVRFPVFHSVAADFLTEMFCLFFQIYKMVVFIP